MSLIIIAIIIIAAAAVGEALAIQYLGYINEEFNS
jgi:hypothetical protein